MLPGRVFPFSSKVSDSSPSTTQSGSEAAHQQNNVFCRIKLGQSLIRLLKRPAHVCGLWAPSQVISPTADFALRNLWGGVQQAWRNTTLSRSRKAGRSSLLLSLCRTSPCSALYCPAGVLSGWRLLCGGGYPTRAASTPPPALNPRSAFLAVCACRTHRGRRPPSWPWPSEHPCARTLTRSSQRRARLDSRSSVLSSRLFALWQKR